MQIDTKALSVFTMGFMGSVALCFIARVSGVFSDYVVDATLYTTIGFWVGLYVEDQLKLMQTMKKGPHKDDAE